MGIGVIDAFPKIHLGHDAARPATFQCPNLRRSCAFWARLRLKLGFMNDEYHRNHISTTLQRWEAVFPRWPSTRDVYIPARSLSVKEPIYVVDLERCVLYCVLTTLVYFACRLLSGQVKSFVALVRTIMYRLVVSGNSAQIDERLSCLSWNIVPHVPLFFVSHHAENDRLVFRRR